MIPSIFVQPPRATGFLHLYPPLPPFPRIHKNPFEKENPRERSCKRKEEENGGEREERGRQVKGGQAHWVTRAGGSRAGQIKVPFFSFSSFYSFGELSWGDIHTSGGKGRESQQKSGRELQYTVIRIVCILFGDYNNCGVYVDALDPARACLTWLIVRVCCVCCVVSSQGDTRPVHAMQIALLGRWWYEFLEKKKPAKLDRTIRLTYTRT